MQILRQDQTCWEAIITTENSRWWLKTIGISMLSSSLIFWFVWQYFIQHVPLLAIFQSPILWIPNVLVAVIINAGLTYETQTVLLDKSSNRFRITQRNIFRQRMLQGNCEQVHDIRITRASDSDGLDRFQVTLQIVGNPSVPLTLGHSIEANELEQFGSLRQFLGLGTEPSATVNQTNIVNQTNDPTSKAPFANAPLHIHPTTDHNKQNRTSLVILNQTTTQFKFKIRYAFWGWCIIGIAAIVALFMAFYLLPFGTSLSLLAVLPLLAGGLLLYIVGFEEVWTFNRATGSFSIHPRSFLPTKHLKFKSHVVTAIKLVTEYPNAQEQNATTFYNVHILTRSGVKLRQGATVGRIVYGFSRLDTAENFSQALQYYCNLQLN